MYVLYSPQTDELITHQDIKAKSHRFVGPIGKSNNIFINNRTHKIYDRKKSAEKMAEKINKDQWDQLGKDRKVEVRSIEEFPIGYSVDKSDIYSEVPDEIVGFRYPTKETIERLPNTYFSYEEAEKKLYEALKEKRRELESEVEKAIIVEKEKPEFRNITDEQYRD